MFTEEEKRDRAGAGVETEGGKGMSE